jgi:hypothetical protein
MYNSGIAAPKGGTWGTEARGEEIVDCPGTNLCPSRTWEPKTARFLEMYKDSGQYFCYDKKGNSGAVCGMSKSGIWAPAGGTWGTNQADCSRAECGWEGINEHDCVAQNCRWDVKGSDGNPLSRPACFYAGNTFGKGCRSDICGDFGGDCCAVRGDTNEPRKCNDPSFKVVAGGTSKYADCAKHHGLESVYQCCKPN